MASIAMQQAMQLLLWAPSHFAVNRRVPVVELTHNHMKPYGQINLLTYPGMNQTGDFNVLERNENPTKHGVLNMFLVVLWG
jgi:hypothetical protein